MESLLYFYQSPKVFSFNPSINLYNTINTVTSNQDTNSSDIIKLLNFNNVIGKKIKRKSYTN